MEVGRADLLLAFGEQDEVDRQPPVRRLERVQRGEEGAFRPLLVDRAAAADGAAELVIEDPRLERRRRPFGRVVLLDVVHEIDADGALRAGVERAEHGRHAAGRHLAHAGEAGLGREPGHVVGAFLDVAAARRRWSGARSIAGCAAPNPRSRRRRRARSPRGRCRGGSGRAPRPARARRRRRRRP